ncbi:MAG: sensor domain-containing diguanylate cyclase [Candidatus Omnitrophota bacterium]
MGKVNDYRRIFDLSAEISSQMGGFPDFDQLITFFVNKMAHVFEVGRVSFMFLDKAKGELFIKASYGLDFSAGKAIIKLGQMFAGWVAQQGKPLLVKDIDSEYPNLAKKKLFRYHTKSFVVVPIEVKEGVIGILNMTERENSGIFNEDDLKIIIFLCQCLALHIENIKLQDKNHGLSTTDNLTGLFNHRYLQERLFDELYRSERYKHELSLMMMDIDNFCWYNQTFGYSAGDSALKQIGRIIKENTRRVDICSRYGAEEFMVILPETRLKEALIVAEKIKETISSSIFAEDRTSSLSMARLTVSIGVTRNRVGLTKEELIRQVANALLEAKQKGKNRICTIK